MIYPHNPSVSFADARTREQVGHTIILGDLSGFRGVLDQFQGCSAQKGVAGESITLTVPRLNWQLLARSPRIKPWYNIYIESLSPGVEPPDLKNGRMPHSRLRVYSLMKISGVSSFLGASPPQPHRKFRGRTHSWTCSSERVRALTNGILDEWKWACGGSQDVRNEVLVGRESVNKLQCKCKHRYTNSKTQIQIRTTNTNTDANTNTQWPWRPHDRSGN